MLNQSYPAFRVSAICKFEFELHHVGLLLIGIVLDGIKNRCRGFLARSVSDHLSKSVRKHRHQLQRSSYLLFEVALCEHSKFIVVSNRLKIICNFVKVINLSTDRIIAMLLSLRWDMSTLKHHALQCAHGTTINFQKEINLCKNCANIYLN